MKKVRLFAVAAAMGMFASTVAAAEPVVSTSYTTTWGEVSEIVKVDVGDKVVAPTTTVKVVKETRTTSTDENAYTDVLGFEKLEECAADEDGDGYTDSQIYFNGFGNATEPGFFTSELEAVKEWLVDNHKVLAPGAAELEEVYYSKYLNQYFADLEAVYDFLEEKGLVVSVYDEEGDLSKVYINPIEATDKNGNLLAKARLEVTAQTGKKGEEKTKEAVAKYLIGAGNLVAADKVLYTTGDVKSTTLDFKGTWKATGEATASKKTITLGSIVVVEEHRGEYEIVAVYPGLANDKAASTNDYTHAGWLTDEETNVTIKGTDGKVTVYELVDDEEVTKLATVAPVKVGKYTLASEMNFDAETGLFVKEEQAYADFDTTGSLATNDFSGKVGYWWNHKYELVDEENETYRAAGAFTNAALNIGVNAFGIEYLGDVEENPTDKYLLKIATVTGVNTKEGKVTLPYAGTKEVVVDYVEVDDVNYAAFDSMETLVKVASKLDEFADLGIKFRNDDVVNNITGTPSYNTWYTTTEALANNPWSGYTQEVETPETELQGPASEACTYVIEEKSEEVEATITSDADSVDTSVAGVKTLTLTAKVGEEVVSTKEVKVVVAPKYERTYVNGRVSVLKAFHLNGNLYAEYHYDWAAKTYSATFYQQDGVTVGSTANGTL